MRCLGQSTVYGPRANEHYRDFSTGVMASGASRSMKIASRSKVVDFSCIDPPFSWQLTPRGLNNPPPVVSERKGTRCCRSKLRMVYFLSYTEVVWNFWALLSNWDLVPPCLKTLGLHTQQNSVTLFLSRGFDL